MAAWQQVTLCCILMKEKLRIVTRLHIHQLGFKYALTFRASAETYQNVTSFVSTLPASTKARAAQAVW